MADTKTLVSAQEQHKIDRAVLQWINKCPEVSTALANAKLGNDIIQYEQLPADGYGMMISVIQGAFIVSKYIYGGYSAEYQFQLVYRVKPSNFDGRLKAVEVLDSIGDWACANPPAIDGVNVKNVEEQTRAALLAKYENGDEDYQILIRLNYEVI